MPASVPPSVPPTGDALDGSPDVVADASAQGSTSEEVPLLPVLSPEALSARAEAQRALLGRGLFEDAQGRPVPWLSSQDEPLPGESAIDDDLLLSLQGSSGLGGSTEAPATSGIGYINGNALGLFEPIEGPEGDAHLGHFHQALRDLRAGRDPDGKVRVLLYGGSHTDADIYPHYVRAYLQERFGDGGHGFVHVAKPWAWYGHVELEVEGFKYWKTEHAQRRDGRSDGYFGLLGASLSTRDKRAFGRVRHRPGTVGSIYEIMYLEQPKGGSFEVFADGRRAATVRTRGPEPKAGYHTLRLPEGEHEIEIRPVGDGEVRLFGMTIERDTPGVVVDTLGIGGTRAANILKWDEAVWGDNVRRRAPDLYALFYGTNEATDADRPIEIYERELREVLDKFRRVAPEASCLLIGPGDFPLPTESGWVPRPRLLQIVEIQARVAAEKGCGFWDTLAFMGGPLSMTKWVHATPQMAKNDHIHLTRRGYVRLGMALVDAMMLAYDGGDDLVSRTAIAGP